ncbi:MAG: hypothetical protein ACLQIB_30780 [Isosphaeraceae bacterium]
MPVLQGALALALSLTLIATTSEDPNRVTVKGTHLSLVPQKGFTESQNFAGFESEAHEASVMVIELPMPGGAGALKKIEERYTPAVLRSRGFVLTSQERGNQNGFPWLTLKGKLRKEDKAYVQWIFFWESRDPQLAEVLVTAPADDFPAVENDLKLMLASLRWEPRAGGAQADRYYSISLPKGWKLAKQFGPVDMYTESGRFPKAKDESAIGVTLLTESRGGDFKAFVKDMNLKRKYYTGLKELQSGFLKIDGFDANISHVSALDVTDQRPVVLQYCYISLGKATMFIEGERTSKLNQELFENTCKTIKIKQ